jgi:hypothetical protein
MIKKMSVIDQIEITRDGHVQVKRADLIIENGKEIAKVYHRHALSPGDSMDNEDDKVKVVANAVWTPEVISAYQEKLSGQQI